MTDIPLHQPVTLWTAARQAIDSNIKGMNQTGSIQSPNGEGHIIVSQLGAITPLDYIQIFSEINRNLLEEPSSLDFVVSIPMPAIKQDLKSIDEVIQQAVIFLKANKNAKIEFMSLDPETVTNYSQQTTGLEENIKSRMTTIHQDIADRIGKKNHFVVVPTPESKYQFKAKFLDSVNKKYTALYEKSMAEKSLYELHKEVIVTQDHLDEADKIYEAVKRLLSHPINQSFGNFEELIDEFEFINETTQELVEKQIRSSHQLQKYLPASSDLVQMNVLLTNQRDVVKRNQTAADNLALIIAEKKHIELIADYMESPRDFPLDLFNKMDWSNGQEMNLFLLATKLIILQAKQNGSVEVLDEMNLELFLNHAETFLSDHSVPYDQVLQRQSLFIQLEALKEDLETLKTQTQIN